MKRKFERKLATQVKACPTRYYSYVQSKGATRNSIATLVRHDGSAVYSDKMKAELFLQYFQSVHRIDNVVPLGDPESATLSAGIPSIRDVPLDVHRVSSALSSLVGSKSAGPDDIHPHMLKIRAPVIAPHALDIYDDTIRHGIIPVD